jgi:hypothetical protein
VLSNFTSIDASLGCKRYQLSIDAKICEGNHLEVGHVVGHGGGNKKSGVEFEI